MTKTKYFYGAVILAIIALGSIVSVSTLSAKASSINLSAQKPSAATVLPFRQDANQGTLVNSFITTVSNASLPSLKTQDADFLPEQQVVPSRYIVQLTEQSVSKTYRNLTKQTGTSTSKIHSMALVSIKTQLAVQRTKILSQQDSFLASLPSSIRTRNKSLNIIKQDKKI